MDFAVSPGMTASQVSARVNSPRMPAAASQAAGSAPVRKPISRAIRMTKASVIALDTSEVITCPHSTDDRATGIECSRATIPVCRVVEDPHGGVRDAAGGGDQQDAAQQVADVVVGAGVDRSAEYVDEQQHEHDRHDRDGDDGVRAALDVAHGTSEQDDGVLRGFHRSTSSCFVPTMCRKTSSRVGCFSMYSTFAGGRSCLSS